MIRMGCAVIGARRFSAEEPSSSSTPTPRIVHPILKWTGPVVVERTRKAPKYPSSAQKAGVEARVLLQVRIEGSFLNSSRSRFLQASRG